MKALSQVDILTQQTYSPAAMHHARRAAPAFGKAAKKGEGTDVLAAIKETVAYAVLAEFPRPRG